MRKLSIAIALVISVSAVAVSVPVMAQDEASEATAKPASISAWRVAMSEIAILRYRTALKLNAEQEKYWPAVANALRMLAHEPELNEQAVRRFMLSASSLYATLDDRQKQTAMNFVQKAGLAEYASLP